MSFDKAAAEIKNIGKTDVQLSNDELLVLYGLFKQGTVGDNTTDKPGMFALKEKKKWEAWNANKGQTKEAAQQAYITKAKELLTKYKLPINF